MTKGQFDEAWKELGLTDRDELVVPSPSEPGRAGVAVTRVGRQKNGKGKLCCLHDQDRETELSDFIDPK